MRAFIDLGMLVLCSSIMIFQAQGGTCIRKRTDPTQARIILLLMRHKMGS
jgi:hypothetical protein